MDTRELIKKWISWKSKHEKKSYPYRTLAMDAGINPNYLSNVMTGIRNPGVKTLEKIARALGISMTEFYSGPPEVSSHPFESAALQSPVPKKAESEKDVLKIELKGGKNGVESTKSEKFGLKLSQNTSEEFDKLFSTLGYNTSDMFVPQSKYSPLEQIKYGIDSFDHTPAETGVPDTIPLLNESPSGDWQECIAGYGKNRAKYTSIPRFFGVKGTYVFAIRVGDDSMSPELNEGDVLIIDPEISFTNTNGGIGVVRDRDRFKIRRIFIQGNNYLLLPSNPHFELEIIPKENTTFFKIALWIPRAENKF